MADGQTSMRRKTIEKNLRKALLEDGSFAMALYEYELEEHLEEYKQSKRADNDEYFFAITEHTNDVAMLLIDQDDTVYINEDARATLKRKFKRAYKWNLRLMIPDVAQQLDEGFLYSAGVKTSDKV